jgi:tRNA (guanine-N7-)-methyltransferase
MRPAPGRFCERGGICQSWRLNWSGSGDLFRETLAPWAYLGIIRYPVSRMDDITRHSSTRSVIRGDEVTSHSCMSSVTLGDEVASNPFMSSVIQTDAITSNLIMPVTQDVFNEDGKFMRKIRSFVRREGRLTKGQEKALEELWPVMGIDFAPAPLDLVALFGREAPVVLEIGFGMGASLVEMAKNAPEKNFIGIEVHSPGVGACLGTAEEAGVTNLKVICHDAVEVLEHMIPNGSLACLQLFFPDPWHKSRHHKRRIVQSAFAQDIRQKLAIGGVFHMATDWENYAEHMLEVMSVAEGYENTSATGNWVPRPDWRPLTKFEQRGHRLGHGVWDLIFKRVN